MYYFHVCFGISGVVEALAFARDRSVVGTFGAALRLCVFYDVYRLLVHPNYQTLHPLFAKPYPLCVQATLKAVPTILLQTYATYAQGSTDIELVCTSTLVRSSVTIAFALATHEASDFKHRHIPLNLSYTSWAFVQLCLYRFLEVFSRLLALSLLAAISTPATLLLLFNPVILLLIFCNGTEDRGAPPVWIQLSRIFVFLDHRTQAGVPTLNPDWYYLIRQLEYFGVAAAVAGPVNFQHFDFLDEIDDNSSIFVAKAFVSCVGLFVVQTLLYIKVRKSPHQSLLACVGRCHSVSRELCSSMAHVPTKRMHTS